VIPIKNNGRIPNRFNPLNLNFCDPARPLDARITFTRASSATYFDSDGVLQTAASGVARANQYADHDPATLSCLGFLIEEQRTNSIRNNTMVGASAPSTAPTNRIVGANGLTITISIPTASSGVEIIRIAVSGSPSATTDMAVFFDQITATNGQTWAISSFLRLVAGDFTNIGSIRLRGDQYSSAPAYLSTLSAGDFKSLIGATLERVSGSLTTNNASTASIRPGIGFSCTAGQAVSFTVDIGLPQLELGAFATSPIKTTSAAATRAADVAEMTGTNFSSWYNQSEGSFVVRASFPSSNAAEHAAFAVSDGTANNRIRMSKNTAPQGLIQIITGGSTVAGLSSGVALDGGIMTTLAARYGLDDIALSQSGSAAATDTSATIPTVSRLTFATTLTVPSTAVHIEHLSYYTPRLPNATLQAITS